MFWARLSKEIWKTIHGGKLTIKELAEKTQIPENTLYRSALAYADTPSAMRPSLKLIILVMQATRDFRILKFMCNYFGFLIVRLPRVARCKKNTLDKVRDLQQQYVDNVDYLLEYDRNPSKENRTNCIKALFLSIEAETSVIRSLRSNWHQLELEF